MSWTSADISVEIDAMTRLLQARPGVIDLEDKALQFFEETSSRAS